MRDRYSMVLEPYRKILEDRAAVHKVEGGWVVLVADGAGGISHGDRAADLLAGKVADFLEGSFRPDDERTWTTLLARCDAELYHEPDCGQTTAVIVAITDRWLCGASVGDSEAWFQTSTGCHVLTASQRRKPFLGSGCAAPSPFHRNREDGMLLVATDGLFKSADRAPILAALDHAPTEACRQLDRLARLPNGSLRDDLGIVVLDLSQTSA